MTAAMPIAAGMVAAAAKPAKAPLFKQRGFGRLFKTELKVWSRDRANVLWALVFPAVIMGFNALGQEGFATTPINYLNPEMPSYHHFYGMTLLQIVLPLTVAMAAAMPFVGILPVSFGGFREKGVLKRFSGSPMRPAAIVAVHYLIALAGVVGGLAILLGVVGAVWGITMPANLGVVALGFILGTSACAAIGTLIGARVAKGTVANALGTAAFFVLIIAAGSFGGLFNETFMQFARFSPLGAMGYIMEAGWFGGTLPLPQVAALAAWTLILGVAGVKLFKWR